MFGVGAKIHYDLVNLGRIGQHRRRGTEALNELDGAGQRRTQEFETLLHHGFQINDLPFLALPPAEGQNLLHEIFRPFSGPQNLLEIFLGFGRPSISSSARWL